MHMNATDEFVCLVLVMEAIISLFIVIGMQFWIFR